MTFVLKQRGARGLMLADYECPVHGRFEATVQRNAAGDPPDMQPCPRIDTLDITIAGEAQTLRTPPCDLASGYRICAPLTRVNPIEAVKGKWEKPERKTYTDTRNIGEGQGLEDWQDDRKRVWEERRKQDVYNFAREHNERVIGGD